jgi:translation initiation factor 2 alpha subunit (eIF-2alpha)
MFEKKDELIEINLKRIIEQKKHSNYSIHLVDKEGKQLKKWKEFSQILEEKNLIRYESLEQLAFELTDFAYDLYEKYGSWFKYLESEKSRETHNLEIKNKEEEKLALDLNLLKRTLQDYNSTKWMARISVFLSTILAIYEIYKIYKAK